MYVGEGAGTQSSLKWSGKQFALYQVDQKLVFKNKQQQQKNFCHNYSELWLIGYVLIKT